MWYFWGKNSSTVRVPKKFLGYRARCCSSFVDRLSDQHWRFRFKWLVFRTYRGYSNFRWLKSRRIQISTWIGINLVGSEWISIRNFYQDRYVAHRTSINRNPGGRLAFMVARVGSLRELTENLRMYFFRYLLAARDRLLVNVNLIRFLNESSIIRFGDGQQKFRDSMVHQLNKICKTKRKISLIYYH